MRRIKTDASNPQQIEKPSPLEHLKRENNLKLKVFLAFRGKRDFGSFFENL
jgi:hypothetical protein